MNLYNEICEMDILKPIAHLDLTPDWKIKMGLANSPQRPWINAKHCGYRDCGVWHDFYFKYYKIIPKGCRNCWKVVLHPKTLKELFKVYDLQKQMATPSKCGIEKRGYSGRKGRYAAFWYCPIDAGLQGARAHFEMIKKKVDHLFGMHEHNLFLKRGCTEMENHTIQQGRGGSDNWDKHAPVYDKVEKMLDEIFVPCDTLALCKKDAPWFVHNYVKRQWIEWAFEHNDKTYLEFTDGEPLLKSHMKYNDSIHSNIDYESNFDKERVHEYHNNRSEDAQEAITNDREPEPKLTVL